MLDGMQATFARPRSYIYIYTRVVLRVVLCVVFACQYRGGGDPPVLPLRSWSTLWHTSPMWTLYSGWLDRAVNMDCVLLRTVT